MSTFAIPLTPPYDCNGSPLEVVGRDSDSQLQVGHNLNKITQEL